MTEPSSLDIGGGAGFRGSSPLTFTPVNVNTFAAPGNSASVAIPAAEMWEFTYIAITFNTSATVANRSPFLVITDSGGNDIYLVPVQWPAQTASLGIRWSWILGWNRDTQTPPPVMLGLNTQASHLPDKFIADGGQVFKVKIENLAGADQITSLIYSYRKYSARAKKLTLL